jgi:hypothetical protein
VRRSGLCLGLGLGNRDSDSTVGLSLALIARLIMLSVSVPTRCPSSDLCPRANLRLLSVTRPASASDTQCTSHGKATRTVSDGRVTGTQPGLSIDGSDRWVSSSYRDTVLWNSLTGRLTKRSRQACPCASRLRRATESHMPVFSGSKQPLLTMLTLMFQVVQISFSAIPHRCIIISLHASRSRRSSHERLAYCLARLATKAGLSSSASVFAFKACRARLYCQLVHEVLIAVYHDRYKAVT